MLMKRGEGLSIEFKIPEPDQLLRYKQRMKGATQDGKKA
jgi:hypothetical protein